MFFRVYLSVSGSGRLSSQVLNYIQRGIIKNPRGKTVFGERPLCTEGAKKRKLRRIYGIKTEQIKEGRKLDRCAYDGVECLHNNSLQQILWQKGKDGLNVTNQLMHFRYNNILV